MAKNEIDSALEYLREHGHNVGKIHMPPPQVGNALRVWIDDQSLSFEQVIELAATERRSSIPK